MKGRLEPRDPTPEQLAIVNALMPGRVRVLAEYGYQRLVPVIAGFSEDMATRLGTMLRVAAGQPGLDADRLVDRVGADPRLAGLLLDAIRAAEHARFDAKVAMLGRALADGVLAADDTSLDMATLALDAVAQIEQPHLTVLAHIAEIQARAGGSPLPTRSELADELAALAQGIGPIVALLTSLALCTEMTPQSVQIGGQSPIEPVLQVTDFGVRVLDYYKAAAEQAP
jgi:hypothetical protein